MQKPKSFKKILVAFGVVSVGFFGIYYFVYMDIKNKNEHISALTQELKFQSNRQEYLISTQRMIQSISSDIDKVNNSIVSNDSDVAFIESLESVAKSNGLSIHIDSLVIEDDPSFSSSGITTLKIKAKTVGTWSGTYTFLAELESLPRKVRINKFSFVADESLIGTKKAVEWQSSFEIRVLKYK